MLLIAFGIVSAIVVALVFALTRISKQDAWFWAILPVFLFWFVSGLLAGSFYHDAGNVEEIRQEVLAGGREEKVDRIDDTHLRVSVKEPPVRGRANRAIIALLAIYFGVPQASVRIVHGAFTKSKVIDILERA